MVLFKRLLLLFCVGGLLGDVAAMLLGPKAVTWFQQPQTGGALCNCAAVAYETATAMVMTQLWASLGGGLVLAFMGELLWRVTFGRPKAAAAGSAPGLPEAGSPEAGSAALEQPAAPEPAAPQRGEDCGCRGGCLTLCTG